MCVVIFSGLHLLVMAALSLMPEPYCLSLLPGALRGRAAPRERAYGEALRVHTRRA